MIDFPLINLEKHKILIIGIVIILILIYFFYPSLIPFLTKNCKTEDCFNKAALKCRPAKFIRLESGNTFEYRVKGRLLFSDCLIYIKMKEMAQGTAQDIKELFENKGMICRISKKQMPKELTNMQEITDFCTGPLKESMYELIIRKMYSMVAGQMGSIIVEMGKALNTTG